MMTFFYFAIALATSLLGVFYLLAIDEKRRRVLRTAQRIKIPRSTPTGWACVLLPGLILIFLGQISAFLAWFGAVTVCAWLIACKEPRSRQKLPSAK